MEENSKSNLSSTFTEISIGVLLLLIAAALFGNYISAGLGWYRDFLTWWYGFDWKNINRGAAILFSIINLLLIAFIIRNSIRYRELVRQQLAHPTAVYTRDEMESPRRAMTENWTQIQALAASPAASDWNMAILRADALLDETLQRFGYVGETLSDRLKIVDRTQIPSLDQVWSAHRLRNLIAHEPTAQHPKESIHYALKSYEQAFRELNVL